MKIITKPNGELYKLIFEKIEATLKENPEANIAFDVNLRLAPLYEKIAPLDFSRAAAFCTASFEDGAACDYMNKALFNAANFPAERIFYPDLKSPETYDRLIKEIGGIDLAVVSTGQNARLSYNEPATPFDTQTRLQRLTEPTLAELGALEKAPAAVATMGIKTLMGAKTVLFLAEGEELSDAVHKLVYGKTLTFAPISMLQMHMDLTVFLDEAAASKL